MLGKMLLALMVAGIAVGGMVGARAPLSPATEPGVKRVNVVFTGGYETDRRDGGRPVVLIAGALGVTAEKFREAFSGVTPARGGAPEPAQARRNKEALMRVLGPLGVTNERLDEVSNFYRYRPQDGELWKHRPAKAYARIKDGVITGFEIADAGYGYSTAPRISIEGMSGVQVTATIAFSTDLQKNGSVGALAVAGAATRPGK
jgi:hypothetical protein